MEERRWLHLAGTFRIGTRDVLSIPEVPKLPVYHHLLAQAPPPPPPSVIISLPHALCSSHRKHRLPAYCPPFFSPSTFQNSAPPLTSYPAPTCSTCLHSRPHSHPTHFTQGLWRALYLVFRCAFRSCIRLLLQHRAPLPVRSSPQCTADAVADGMAPVRPGGLACTRGPIRRQRRPQCLRYSTMRVRYS